MSVRSLVKKWLLDRGMIISRPPGQFNMGSYKLAAARDRGLDIQCAIDGGAATGTWSTELRKIWPNARILCIEPRDDAQQALRQVQAELGNLEIAKTLLGSSEGEVDFYLGLEASSINREFAPSTSELKRQSMAMLDKLVQGTPFERPDLIKLDLQGAELSALEGAEECMKHATAIQLEVSFLEFSSGIPLIADVFAFLKKRDFVAYDILGLWHRPFDGAMAQGDILFLRTQSPLRADHRYWADASAKKVASGAQCAAATRK